MVHATTPDKSVPATLYEHFLFKKSLYILLFSDNGACTSLRGNTVYVFYRIKEVPFYVEIQ